MGCVEARPLNKLPETQTIDPIDDLQMSKQEEFDTLDQLFSKEMKYNISNQTLSTQYTSNISSQFNFSTLDPISQEKTYIQLKTIDQSTILKRRQQNLRGKRRIATIDF